MHLVCQILLLGVAILAGLYLDDVSTKQHHIRMKNMVAGVKYSFDAKECGATLRHPFCWDYDTSIFEDPVLCERYWLPYLSCRVNKIFNIKLTPEQREYLESSSG